MTITPETHKILLEIFENKLIRGWDDQTIFTEISETYLDNEEDGVNALADNFEYLIQLIREDFLTNYEPKETVRIEYYFGTYIYWLYLVTERVHTVLDFINPDGKFKIINDFKYKNFETLKEIKNWCIFLKHPKEFIFSHLNSYSMETDTDTLELYKDTSFFTLIDKTYIEKNYTKNSKKLPGLENNQGVVIVLPELEDLTKRFCDELIIFKDFLIKNDIIADFLKDKTNIENYYNQEQD